MEQVTKIWNWSTDADGWTFNQGLISTDTYWSSGAAEGNSARVTQDVLETIYDPIIHSRLTQEVIETLYDPVVSARSTQEVVETSYDPVVSARVTQEVIEIVTSDIEAPNPLGWAAWNPMIRVLQTDTRQVHRFRGTVS